MLVAEFCNLRFSAADSNDLCTRLSGHMDLASHYGVLFCNIRTHHKYELRFLYLSE